MTTSFNSDPINQFVKLVNTARDYNSKEIRLSRAEAESLALSITELLARDVGLTQKLMETQERLITTLSAAPRNLDLNGGTF